MKPSASLDILSFADSYANTNKALAGAEESLTALHPLQGSPARLCHGSGSSLPARGDSELPKRQPADF